MINLKEYKGFALLKKDNSKEAQAVMITCALQKIPYIRVNKKETLPKEYVPCGSVEWIESILGYHPIPDYYPEFLSSDYASSEYLYRKVWEADKWPLNETCFIKPADRYKRFTGFVHKAGSYKGKKKGPYWCSDVVNFVNEWRYYISNGKVLCGEWYWGDEEKMPDAPRLEIWVSGFVIKIVNFPADFCGAVDFGETDKGEFALIESQCPYSCGWYGKNHEMYCKWVISGWEYMKKEISYVKKAYPKF